MSDFNSLKVEINTFLDNLSLGKPRELYDPMVYTLKNGGKRARAILNLLSYQLFTGEYQEAMPVAGAIEVFHNFTLLHDDIMDNAPIRRGKESAFKKYGQDTAILSGDMMMIKAYSLIENVDNLSPLLKEFNKVALEVCEGQQMDMNFENRDDVSIIEYLEMIRLKTSVLLASAMKMGAILADADNQDQISLYQYGLNLGLAFQIQDDYLDSFGDPKTFGKQIGGDILQGKKTILYLKHVESLSKESERLDFQNLYSGFSKNKVEKVKSAFINSGALDQVLSLKSDFEQKARVAFKPLRRLDQQAVTLLDQMVKSLDNRKS